MKTWPQVSLADLTEETRPICYGVLKPGPFVEQGVPMLRIQDLANDWVALSGHHMISGELDAEFSRSRLSGGEVLLSIQGTIGRVAICPDSFAGANISRTLAIIAPDERLDARFLKLFLMYTREFGGFQTSGSTRASLNISTIRSIRVPIPPINEQLRIVDTAEDYFSQLEAAEAGMHTAARKATTLLNALRRRFVAEAATLAESIPLSQACTIMGGRTPSKLDAYLEENAQDVRDIPFYKVGDMNSDAEMMSDARTHLSKEDIAVLGLMMVPPGSILIPKAGGAIATNKKRIVATAGVVDLNCMAIVPGLGIDPHYLHSWFLQVDLAQLSDGSVLPQLSKRTVGALSLPVPDVLEQKRLVERLREESTSLDRLQSTIAALGRRIQSSRRSLLRAAISGNLGATGSNTREREAVLV